VDRPAGAALCWITGRARATRQDVTGALRTLGADGAMPTVLRRRRPALVRSLAYLEAGGMVELG